MAVKPIEEASGSISQQTFRAAPGLKFGASNGFDRELRRRVGSYFESTGLRERDCLKMYVKTAVIFVWLALSYSLLVFGAQTWQVALPLALSLGLAVAAVGLNVQHDGGHHAYSNRRWINKLAAMSLDLLGGSSYIWARKHNSIHHTFSNITGHDDDIDLGVLARLSPHQERFKFHRLQHIYLWVLYGLLSVKWHFFSDFQNVITGRISGHPFARPKGWDLFVFVGGKVAFFSLALVIPLLLHSVWTVLAFYLFTAYVQGITLSIVFQLAHCVEEAEFPMPQADTGRMESHWAVHQVETTVDFAQRNWILSWFIGGLNFQVEHHLFPQICHVHYSAIAPLVEQTCEEFGLTYKAHKTFRSGVASHFRWLRRMGMTPAVSAEIAA